MADSASLSATPPINNPSNSSHIEHSPLIYPMNSHADYALQRPGTLNCGPRLGPSQVARQHISVHSSSTLTDSRSPASSNENNDVENSPRLPIGDPGYKSAASTLEDLMSTCREKFGSGGKYSRITKVPQQLRSFQSGKLLNKFRNDPHSQSETVLTPSTSANIFKLWKWEMLNCVLAIGMLGSIYGILQYYNGRRIPDWGSAINLSTLIALIATLLRMMLSFVVTEIIGQAKWKYFAGDRQHTEGPPMRRSIEISRFNDASQGPLDALKLIPTILRDSATLLAVMVMIVSLGTGSFVQQAIQTESCQFSVDSVKASIPVSRNTTAGLYNSTFEPLEYPNMFQVLSSALSNETDSSITVGCSTGNCTFKNSIDGVYSTLGVCSLCTDTSSLITSTEESYDPLIDVSTANYTLPNGMSAQALLDHLAGQQRTQLLASTHWEDGLSWAGDLVSPEMMALSQWAFANVTILTSNLLPTSSGYMDYVAATCTLYSCLRSYNASVISGKLDEVLVSTVPAVPNAAAAFAPNITTEAVQDAVEGEEGQSLIFLTLDDLSLPLQAVKSPCLANDTIWTNGNQSSIFNMQRLLLLHADPNPNRARRFRIENTSAPAECIYSMDYWAWSEFEDMGNFFSGICPVYSLIRSPENSTWIDCDETYWLAMFYNDNGITAASIIERFEDIADRLSNKMRMGLLNYPEVVSGQVLQETVCTRIYYPWLTFPAVLVAVTSGLLAWTMLQSSRRRGREMVWKTSILPFLFYGDRFVVQNGEDMSAYSNESLRRDEGPKEPLLDLDQMQAEAKQRVVRFKVFD